jgi:hypothetical protein
MAQPTEHQEAGQLLRHLYLVYLITETEAQLDAIFAPESASASDQASSGHYLSGCRMVPKTT